jgi:hypothetical protein
MAAQAANLKPRDLNASRSIPSLALFEVFFDAMILSRFFIERLRQAPRMGVFALVVNPCG